MYYPGKLIPKRATQGWCLPATSMRFDDVAGLRETSKLQTP